MIESSIERQLKECWHIYLGNIEIKLYDDFFSLGGDSLLFFALVKKLEKTFFIDCTLIKQGIINFSEQLGFLKSNLNLLNDKVVVQISPGSKEQVIVFIHPIGGTLFLYLPLVKKINSVNNRYCLGIQDRFITGDFSTYSSVEDQVCFYVSKIEREIINSSIILIGHSSGGTLAFEMVRQLLKKKINVEHLIMLDAWAKIPFDIDFRDRWKDIILRQVNIIKPYSFLVSPEQLDYWLEVLWHRMCLLYKYKAVSLPIDATLFIPKLAIQEYTVDKTVSNDWQKYVNNLQIHHVDGSHENMLNETYVDDLCNKILPLL